MRDVTNPAGPELRDAIDQWAARIATAAGRPAAEMFGAMMLDTWCTTMSRIGDRTFVITGDIPAMWLRDSSAQVLPFLQLTAVPEVTEVLRGLVREQWRCIALDPYANAFNASETGAHFDTDDLELHPGVWERKYEIDSLAFPVQLAHQLWQATGDSSHLDEDVRAGCHAITALWRTEQHHEAQSTYRHIRPAEPQDTLGEDGRGTPVAVTGMTWSGFRPSDDACTFGYNIPAQLMAVMALRMMGEFADLWHDDALRSEAAALAADITAGVEQHAMTEGRFAYEVDGLGNQLCMDDANMPALLSLPLTSDVGAGDPRYVATRRWILSPANPFHYEGTAAAGIGSPHTPPRYIWHIGLAVQGLTGDMDEARSCLDTLMATDGDTGRMHEGFHADDPTQFTREWFSWANSMACALMMRIASA
ncbi:MAG: glycoside hydrolase family 125 protein [Arachnia sp.]